MPSGCHGDVPRLAEQIRGGVKRGGGGLSLSLPFPEAV